MRQKWIDSVFCCLLLMNQMNLMYLLFKIMYVVCFAHWGHDL